MPLEKDHYKNLLIAFLKTKLPTKRKQFENKRDVTVKATYSLPTKKQKESLVKVTDIVESTE